MVPPDFAPVPICQPGVAAVCVVLLLVQQVSFCHHPFPQLLRLPPTFMNHKVSGGDLLLLDSTRFPWVTSQDPVWVYFYASSWLMPLDHGVGDHNHRCSPSVFFWLPLRPVRLSHYSVGKVQMNQIVALHLMISPLVHRMYRTSSLMCRILLQPSPMVAELLQSSQCTGLHTQCNFSHAGQIGPWPSFGTGSPGLKVASGVLWAETEP